MLAEAAIDLCQIWFLFTKGAADQSNRSDLHAIAEGECQAQEIHTYLVGRKGIGAKSCSNDGRCHKAHSHCKVFNQQVIGEMPDGLHDVPGSTDFFFYNIGNRNKRVLFEQGLQ